MSRKTTSKVKIGNKTIKVNALTLKQTLEVIFLLAPYFALIEENWPEFKDIRNKKNRSNLLYVFLRGLRNDLAKAPEDIVKLFSILLQQDVEWINKNASAKDLFLIIPVLDKINNFSKLLEIIEIFNKNYG